MFARVYVTTCTSYLILLNLTLILNTLINLSRSQYAIALLPKEYAEVNVLGLNFTLSIGQASL